MAWPNETVYGPYQAYSAVLDGEDDPDEGMLNQPVHNTTVARLPALIRRLALQYPTVGYHHKIILQLPNGTIREPLVASANTSTYGVGFLLWLPAHFLAMPAGLWPTVVFIHGQAEKRGACDGNEAINDLNNVVHHGLPHKIEERTPFNRMFVLISPQRCADWCTERGIRSDEKDLELIDAMRLELFRAVPQLDRTRVYLTGLSSGGGDVYRMAFNQNAWHSQHPWAAIAVMSGMWPDNPHIYERYDRRPLSVWAAAPLMRLQSYNVLIAHCANDFLSPIDLGALGRPRCKQYPADLWPNMTDLPLEEQMMLLIRRDPRVFRDAAVCGYGADAIVEALRRLNPQINLRYDRFDQCMPPHQPTDSSFVPMGFPHRGVPSIVDANAGHDSWTRLYASDDFINWLLSHRGNVTYNVSWSKNEIASTFHLGHP